VLYVLAMFFFGKFPNIYIYVYIFVFLHPGVERHAPALESGRLQQTRDAASAVPETLATRHRSLQQASQPDRLFKSAQ